MKKASKISSTVPAILPKPVDRKFMDLAIDEMLKSRSEHKNKSDPMVGAVLVAADGKQLGATYRGDLRVGDHAEFTLIERYLREANLEGATLYVSWSRVLNVRKKRPRVRSASKMHD
jgi:ATP-dependent DNA helicase RecG